MKLDHELTNKYHELNRKINRDSEEYAAAFSSYCSLKGREYAMSMEGQIRVMESVLARLEEIKKMEKILKPAPTPEEIAKQVKYGSGAFRSSDAGKGRPDLIPAIGLIRLGRRYQDGATAHGDKNWESGQPFKRYYGAILRHLFWWAAGDRGPNASEDHLAAACWNIMGLMHHEHMIANGKLPATLDNLDTIEETDGTVRESLKRQVEPGEKH